MAARLWIPTERKIVEHLQVPTINCDALGAIEIVGNMAWFYLVQDQACVEDPAVIESVLTGKLFAPVSAIPEALWLMSQAISKEVAERAASAVRKITGH